MQLPPLPLYQLLCHYIEYHRRIRQVTLVFKVSTYPLTMKDQLILHASKLCTCIYICKYVIYLACTLYGRIYEKAPHS
jgi:hypothetical protein